MKPSILAFWAMREGVLHIGTGLSALCIRSDLGHDWRINDGARLNCKPRWHHS